MLTVVIMKETISWDVSPCSSVEIHRHCILLPCSGSKNEASRREQNLLVPSFLLVSYLASTLNMETLYSSETSVEFYRTT
jgi:hypothetical protein